MEQVADTKTILKEKTENILMPGKIVNHVPRLIRERFPDVDDQDNLAIELSFGARIMAGTAKYLVDPSHEPKAIYFHVLANLCDYFGVGTNEIIEYMPE